jgi:hypothetical protein
VRPIGRAGVVAAVVLACAPTGALLAQAKPKPITREWHCDNGRVVLVNYHPRRIREPAWLTYLGNRIEVARTRVDRGITATSGDGKVNWHETGNSAELEFAGLLDQPLHCEAKPEQPGKGTTAKQNNQEKKNP